MNTSIYYAGQETNLQELLTGKNIVIIADSRTNGFCLQPASTLIPALQHAHIVTIPAGEAFKNIDAVDWIWNQLHALQVNKSWCIVNLGGGVVSDVGGFAAATFMRGITCINIPTTLLAMTDASIGGKTGFNYAGVKNRIGLFAEPTAVYINPIFLNTLSDKIICSGAAECIKHALLHNKNLWENYYKLPSLAQFTNLQNIQESNNCKNYFVAQDPLDAGIRQALNFGHSIGHALEASSSNTYTPLLHGEAILLGLIAECYISEKLLGLNADVRMHLTQIKNILFANIKNKSSTDEILTYLLMDKKNTNTINMSLLQAVGNPKIKVAVSTDVIIESLSEI
jgi:3-dehydroquinate synthase